MCLVRTCIPTRVLGGGFQGIPKFEKHVPNGFVWMGGFLCHRLNLLSTHATQLCEGLTFFIFSILSLSLLYIYTYIHKNICIDFCTFNCSAQFHIKNIMKNKCFPPLATVCQQRFTEHLLGAEHCSGCWGHSHWDKILLSWHLGARRWRQPNRLRPEIRQNRLWN